MKILLLSFYYRPDLSAGSFRTTALVEALLQVVPAGSTIDLVTTFPNRYESFTVDALEKEIHPQLTINRFPIPAHKSGVRDQSRSFMAFSRQALNHVSTREYDAVFATSSRLMTAVLAAWISRRKKIPLYLDIRDIFVDTIKDVFPGYLARTVGPLFGMLERWAVTRATRVNLVSPGFDGYFSERYPDKTFSFITNGVDDEFLSASDDNDLQTRDNKSTVGVLYAGNIGEGQGLHVILPELAKRVDGKISFRVIGDGGRKQALLSALTLNNIGNVEILPPVNRDQLMKEYRRADVLFLHLNDHQAFKKVLPSKLFEYAAMGKPVWAGVGGYAAVFVRTEISNAAVFEPCDAEAAEQSFKELSLQTVYRKEFLKKYSRRNLMKKMAIDIVDMIDGK